MNRRKFLNFAPATCAAAALVALPCKPITAEPASGWHTSETRHEITVNGFPAYIMVWEAQFADGMHARVTSEPIAPDLWEYERYQRESTMWDFRQIAKARGGFLKVPLNG